MNADKFRWGPGDVLILDEEEAAKYSAYEDDEQDTIDFVPFAEPLRWITKDGKHILIGGTESQRKSILAKKSHVPITKEKRHLANEIEKSVADITGANWKPDNEPFDAIKGKHAIEVKAIIEGTHDKITMHPDSRMRKLTNAKTGKFVGHTVIIDARNDPKVGGAGWKYYHRKALGSFRLQNMDKVSKAELGRIFK